MRRKGTGADELLEQLDHFKLAGNFSDRPFVIFWHERIVSMQQKLTAEPLRAQSKEFLTKKYSSLCELRVSAVK